MITSKILKSAAGVQVGSVIDKTETLTLPSTSEGVVVGRFKRGRMDRPFKVTISNYQAVLGRDLSNPNFLIVQDALDCGAGEVWVMRVGSSYHEANTDLSQIKPKYDGKIPADGTHKPL